MKYRKKPVVIEAWQWTGDRKSMSAAPAWIQDSRDYSINPMPVGSWAFVNGTTRNDSIAIKTLEGIVTASPNDWIIRGVKGELYPCKPDIFEATYEPAE